jgi:hypothetical protein
MKPWIRMGCVVLGVSAAACAGQQARTSLDMGDAPAVAASSGGGGAATVDTGRFPTRADVDEAAGAKRALYTQVARELKITNHVAPHPDEGVGGSGISAEEKHLCAEALDSGEPVTVVSGIIGFRSSGLVVVDVPGKGAVKLHTDDVTCSVQAGRALPPEALSEGTEARVAYVEDAGGPVARVIRAEPMRPQR